MPLTKKADNVAGAIHEERKQPCDIAAQHTRVKRFRIGDGSKLAAEYHLASSIINHANGRLDDHRTHESTQATNAFVRGNWPKLESGQGQRAENGAIGACVDEKRHWHP
jgi:hypothetical protein